MNYELAKKLKDAGFLQDEDGEGEMINAIDDGSIKWAYVPTLSELIEAFGEDFFTLEKMADFWLASAMDEPLEPLFVQGKTPEEAVAKLWLKLKKHTELKYKK